MRRGPEWLRSLYDADMGLLALVFLLQFSIFAMFITPLWDTPDEVGHMSYIMDVAEGDLPRIGETFIQPEVTESWQPGTGNHKNWIAQHPPLYYLIAAPVYRIAVEKFTDLESRVRATRLVTALLSAMAVYCLMLLVLEATGRKAIALAAGVILASTPMFVHMSSGVSHDTFVLLLCAAGLLFLVRFMRAQGMAYGVAAGVTFGLACAVKMTALVVLAPSAAMAVLWIILVEKESARNSVSRISVIGSAFIVIPALLAAANLVRYGQPYVDAGILIPGGAPKVDIGPWEFIRKHPFWQHILINFYGLIGWQGRGTPIGTNNWFQISTDWLRFFSVPLVIGCCCLLRAGAVIGSEKFIKRETSWLSLPIAIAVAILIAVPNPSFIAVVCTLIFVAFCYAALISLLYPAWSDSESLLFALFTWTSVFFSLVFFLQLWMSYEGQLRATHGRYFYPVLPFMVAVICMCIPPKLDQTARTLSIVFMAGMAIFSYRVIIPFYGV